MRVSAGRTDELGARGSRRGDMSWGRALRGRERLATAEDAILGNLSDGHVLEVWQPATRTRGGREWEV